MAEHRQPIEINAGGTIYSVAFSTDGSHLVSGGGRNWVQVWRAGDLGFVAVIANTMGTVQCLAVSPDGRWIAAGTNGSCIYIWDAKTHKQTHRYRENYSDFRAVNFSPDSSRLVSGSSNKTATIWEVTTERQVQVLRHDSVVREARYSPQGDRIATATYEGSVRLWDSNDGSLLAEFPVEVIPRHNTGLVWYDNHLLVIATGKIIQLDASTGSTVFEWPCADTNEFSCIALPKHGRFVAYASNDTVILWDTSTHTRLGQIQHSQCIRSIAFSVDDRSIAIGGKEGKISIKSLASFGVGTIDRRGTYWHGLVHNVLALIPAQGQQDNRPPVLPDGDSTAPALILDEPPVVSSPSPRIYHAPGFKIDDGLLNLWKQDQFTELDELMTTSITASHEPTHQVLASRALVRTRLQDWATAIVDAETAIEIQPSVLAYIAKGIAYACSGEKYKGYRACDIAFEHLHSSHITFLLLIKAIVVFMAGDHVDALSRTDDLIATVPSSDECRVAYMHLLIGNLHTERRNYDGAIESFERARAKLRPLLGQPLVLISLISGWKFDDLDITTRQRLCDSLYSAGRISNAVECFHEVANILGDAHREWALDFRQRLSEQLKHLGETATSTEKHDEAIGYYSTALSLDPPFPEDLLINRSRAYLATGAWGRALDDANRVITLNPSSPQGYEMKHAALRKGGDHENAVIAFEEMLSKLEQSPDPAVRELTNRYIHPSKTRMKIRKLVNKINRRLPRELINTADGRLYDRAARLSAFESSPIYRELISSTTTRINNGQIKRQVRQYFRYVMFSHKWEDGEPSFQDVLHISVYNLGQSPTRDKLKSFCEIVRDGGFVWAWSDVCCINKSDHFILQEALVAMFKWYEGSALTIVYLRGVHSLSQLGALVRSIWNKRAWTLQEYIAAKVVHFYTEDWTPYLGLQLLNHKESQEVMLEMEEATGVSATELMALRPGLSNIREKLRLASTRDTTYPEDAAYSLLGIFSASGIPAIYGDGSAALGRLLANVIARSGDVSILAWSGDSGRFNSCLPTNIAVFNGPVTTHLPHRILDAEMEAITSQDNPFDVDAALRLYDRLRDLPAPRFSESRMTLPCIIFRLPRFSLHRSMDSLRIYRVNTEAFGMVEVRTKCDLTRYGASLYLVHPWLESIFEHEDVHGGGSEQPLPSPILDDEDDMEMIDGRPVDDEVIDKEASDEYEDLSPLPEHQSPALPSPVGLPVDEETRARRLVTRLRQPFGALLFRVTAADQRVVTYKRVAADASVNVQLRESFPLAHILDRVRTVDVL